MSLLDEKRCDQIRDFIKASPGLSQLFNETVQAALDYVSVNTPAWEAEKSRIAKAAIATGKKGWGVPVHPEALLAGHPDALEEFLFAGLALTKVQITEPELKTELNKVLAEYKAAPAP